MRDNIARFFRLAGIHIRCEWYLLTKGMHRGECKFCGWSKDTGKVSYIAATTGSIFDGTLVVKRVFLNEHE